jgi:hypothetical protein
MTRGTLPGWPPRLLRVPLPPGSGPPSRTGSTGCADPDRVRRLARLAAQHRDRLRPSNLVVIDLDCHGTLRRNGGCPAS